MSRIYHRDPAVASQQASAFHGLPNDNANPAKLRHGTHSLRVVSREFVYCGGEGPMAPDLFRN